MAKVLDIKTNRGKLGYRISVIEDENSGQKRAFARLVPFSTLSEAEVNTWASDFMKVSEAQMKAGFQALADAIQYFVLNGHSVTLDALGCFTFSTKSGIFDEKTAKWKSAGATVAKDVNSQNIRATYVRFRPSTQLRNTLGGAQLFNVEDTAFGEQTA